MQNVLRCIQTSLLLFQWFLIYSPVNFEEIFTNYTISTLTTQASMILKQQWETGNHLRHGFGFRPIQVLLD